MKKLIVPGKSFTLYRDCLTLKRKLLKKLSSMRNFIELTNGGYKRLVNVDNIAYIKEDGVNECAIHFVGDPSNPLLVDESFKKVHSLIIGNI